MSATSSNCHDSMDAETKSRCCCACSGACRASAVSSQGASMASTAGRPSPTKRLASEHRCCSNGYACFFNVQTQQRHPLSRCTATQPAQLLMHAALNRMVHCMKLADRPDNCNASNGGRATYTPQPASQRAQHVQTTVLDLGPTPPCPASRPPHSSYLWPKRRARSRSTCMTWNMLASSPL